MSAMRKNLLSFIKEDLLPLAGLLRKCEHKGETHEHCGKCGADLRAVTSYECRLCELLSKNSIYTTEKRPNFCTSCGAPKFTFRPVKKKRGTPKAQ